MHKPCRHVVRGIVLLLLLVRAAIAAAPATIDIDVNQPGIEIPPTFYGLMTEEINHSYDGGLFAELIQNRTVPDPQGKSAAQDDPPMHWFLVQEGSGAKVTVDTSDPVSPALPNSLKLELAGSRAGVANDGYWGIPVRPDTKYTASFYAKAGDGFAGPVTPSIVTDDGNASVAEASTEPITGNWKKYTITLTTAHDAPTTAKARFLLSAKGKGSVTFSLVSLFPPTYQDTPNGLRPDLMKLMADLRPAFIRLPGGNYVEGSSFPTRFDWKKMIGPAEQRPGHMGCWSYRSSDGFGMPEFLLWCKQLNAEPVLALFAGYTLDRDHVNAGSPDMQKYVDEALEEIEYVTGPADSEWGKRRAADGFPEPFKLHYVEIGNEDWADRSGSYDGRFTQMFDAIRKKYPDLKIIATAPVKSRKPDLYDDHYYRSAIQMTNDVAHYDTRGEEKFTFSGGHSNGTYDASKTKIFLGEWATTEGSPTPTLNAALSDAAWLMALERNADLVPMECYAPLLVNVNPADPAKGYPRAWQWRTNLIGYDAMTSFGSPAYYVQAIFGQNKPDRVLPTKLTVAPRSPEAPTSQPAPPHAPHGAIGIGTWHTNSEFKDIMVTGPDGKTLLSSDATKDISAWRFTGRKWVIQDDALRPSVSDTETWALIGDPNWTDYTIRLKARKVSGNEGFLILFHAAGEDNFFWWNVGGWGNTRTGVEDKSGGGSREISRRANFTVQPNQWYDLRVEVKGNRVRCFADDQLISEATEQPEQQRTTLFASAGYVSASNEVIVKLVNMASTPVEATLNLRGANKVTSSAKAILLTGSPRDVNTIEQPTKVTPKEEPIPDAAASFQRTLPAHSLTLLRLHATPQ